MIYPLILYSNLPSVTETQPVGSFRTGWSESYFEYKLDKYFRGLVFRNETIKDLSRRFPFQPDYVIKLREKQVFIDIEIDEPYTLSQGNYKAIHTIGQDNRRNDYFLSKGWDVISPLHARTIA